MEPECAASPTAVAILTAGRRESGQSPRLVEGCTRKADGADSRLGDGASGGIGGTHTAHHLHTHVKRQHWWCGVGQFGLAADVLAMQLVWAGMA